MVETAKKLTFANFKGGTGKTTNATMVSYHLAKLGYKTLLVDLDPQANATQLLIRTAQRETNKNIHLKESLMVAIQKNKVEDIVINVNENLALLPNYFDFTSYPVYLEELFPSSHTKRIFYLKQIIEKHFNDKYDYIIFDVPPTISIFTDSALVASDYIVVVLQTQERSLSGAEKFISYAQEIYDTFFKIGVNYDIVGILPVLLKNRSKVDEAILQDATKRFEEENMFKNIVKNMERLKRYDMIGIIDPESEKADTHDKKVHELYSRITKELLQRML